MSAVIDYLDTREIYLCHRINRVARREQVRRFFAVISRLGDGGLWFAMGALLLALKGLSAGPLVLQIAVTAAVGVGVYKILKQTLVRERPYMQSGDILCGTAPLDRYSFPSGHTLHAVSFTVLFAHAEPGLLVLCLPFAVLIAASRVVLGLHYPSDVIVGALTGLSLATASIRLLPAGIP